MFFKLDSHIYLVHIYAPTVTHGLKWKKSTSVRVAGEVGFRVPLHSEPELMVPFPPGPLRLRPEDPPAAVRPPRGGLLHKRDGVAHKARHEIVLQEQQMQMHSHVGAAARSGCAK